MYLCVVDQHQPLVFNQPGRTNARDAVMFYLLLPLRTRTCMTSYPSRLNYILISRNFTVFGSSGLSNFCHYCERNLAVVYRRNSHRLYWCVPLYYDCVFETLASARRLGIFCLKRRTG